MPLDLDVKDASVFLVGEDGKMQKLGKIDVDSMNLEADMDTEYDSSEISRLKELKEGVTFELRMDTPDFTTSVRRFLQTVIDERFGSNNWRKHHGLPMWRMK